MAETPTYLAHDQREQRAGWVRLRTIVLLRWLAIFGQLSAILFARALYDLDLEMGLCFLAVGIATITNLVAMVVFPGGRRLPEHWTTFIFLLDLLLLGVLLYLTGGLHNPFALLILGPVTISAAALSNRSTLFLGAVAIAMVTLLSRYYLLLHTTGGSVLKMPVPFVFGHWVALVIGIVFMALNARRITGELQSMQDALEATNLALAREQKLNDLGRVIAATAHELGTPLATIKLTSSELVEELAGQPELQEDALLIRSQAERCRDILRSMGRDGDVEEHLKQAPLMAVLREAAEPHLDRGARIEFVERPGADAGKQPEILRRPELIHGLRNLIQNAVDFSRETVRLEAHWTGSEIGVRIEDDGPGFPPSVLGRIGEPFVRRRLVEKDRDARPEYAGMGLGLFIAKTLLERTGAEINFVNGAGASSDFPGAIVVATWARALLTDEPHAGRSAAPMARVYH
ncbi:sensor histidine kinase RegB [Poseidonocella sedimentorum]|uniref:histidine kinase n=1 Tax=Poseidonocella sedimentorum TaxID=871652 RepID=A0A1I6D6X6_9RHOB|nr:ActS/PrrB/RegB family redox-sensitive histidine kinase [Poseidonocella sedimentorum]SFR01226.1 two-component system, sensor histidine kinase RegB [Poseidonocella sedimentorum]